MNKEKLHLILKGMGMGIAEVIPGVSGGTIAFITGIYHDLLSSIKSFDVEFISLLSKAKFGKAIAKLNPSFLIFVMLGMVLGLGLGIFVVSHYLETQPEMLWGLFFALILGSLPLMYRSLKEIRLYYLAYFIVAIIVAYLITSLTPVDPPESKLYLFTGGMLAITALVLPGISGSFILLILGLYTLVIPTLKSFISAPSGEAFSVLLVFGAGCITGLILFSRLVSKAFEKHHDITVSIMSGFMIGSLNKIWPWRNPLVLLDKETGQQVSFADNAMLTSDRFKLLSEQNVLPADYYQDPKLFLVLSAFVIVMILMGIYTRYAPRI